MAEELETILRLVADGHLTPQEAGPIIEALTRAERSEDAGDAPGPEADAGLAGSLHRDLDRLGERIHRRVERRVAHGLGRAFRHAAGATAGAAMPGAGAGSGRQLRIRVTERGRQVVNLRIPIGFVETALRFVPGLAGDQAERIRDAVRGGAIGPILDVEDADGEGGVLISVE